MGRKGRGRGGGGPLEDQYGEAFVSQDRDSFAAPAGRGGGRMSGGGEAGQLAAEEAVWHGDSSHTSSTVPSQSPCSQKEVLKQGQNGIASVKM